MPDPRLARPENGYLRLISDSDRPSAVEFVPLRPAGPFRSDDDFGPVPLLDVLYEENRLRIYPIRTFADREDFLGPKYGQILCLDVPMELNDPLNDPVQIEELFDWLPGGFIRDFQYGMGLTLEYKALVHAVEEHTDCTEIRIEHNSATGVQGNVFVMAMNDYDACIAELSRIGNRARVAAVRVKENYATNLVGGWLGRAPRALRRGHHPVVKLITEMAADERPLADKEQDQVLGVAIAESRRVAMQRPEVLAKLRSDIELVALESLVERYERDLDARLGEEHWQRFFQENPFALHFAFGYPAILVQHQASVGGRRLDGRGEKITDFLTKNPLTNNVGIFEIKKPATDLLDKLPYRSGVYASSRELSGSITQVLDQKYQLEKSLPLIKDRSGDWALESFAVRCCVVAGMTPEDPMKIKSLELVRNNSRAVDIVTYDELLVRLKQLHVFLAGSET